MSERTRIARCRLRAARAALADSYNRSADAYLAARRWVDDAKAALPWWKRIDIDLTSR